MKNPSNATLQKTWAFCPSTKTKVRSHPATAMDRYLQYVNLAEQISLFHQIHYSLCFPFLFSLLLQGTPTPSTWHKTSASQSNQNCFFSASSFSCSDVWHPTKYPTKVGITAQTGHWGTSHQMGIHVTHRTPGNIPASQGSGRGGTVAISTPTQPRGPWRCCATSPDAVVQTLHPPSVAALGARPGASGCIALGHSSKPWQAGYPCGAEGLCGAVQESAWPGLQVRQASPKNDNPSLNFGKPVSCGDPRKKSSKELWDCTC